MKVLNTVCLMILFSVSACSHKQASTNIVADTTRTVTVKTIKSDTLNARDIHLSNVVLHVFSDSVKKDTFKIDLTGKTILDGKVVFQIIDFRGKKIHNEDFDGHDLLGDLTDAGLSVKQEEDTIRTRMANYFKEGIL